MLISELQTGSVTSTKGQSCCLRLDLVLVLAADRRGLLQAVARLVWGLQWWQTLKGPSLLLRSATSWAANGTCWIHIWLCLVDIGTPTMFGSSRFLYPRLASSAAQPVTWPSSSRLHRSRLRRSNTSCAGSCCLHPSASCSAQPARRWGRPPCIHPRSRTVSAAASKSGAVELGLGRPPRPSWPPSTGGRLEGRVDNQFFSKISTGSGCLCLWVPRGHGESWTNQLRTTLILPLASRQQWAVRERHQRLLTHPLPNYGSR